MPRPLNMQFYQVLKNDLQAGRYSPAAFLPPERQLAETYHVGRCCLRNTLTALSRENLVRLVPRRGWRQVQDDSERYFQQFIVVMSQEISRSGEHEVILNGICEAASEISADIILTFVKKEEDLQKLLQRIEQGNIHGVIFMEVLKQNAQTRKILNSGVPCIVVNLEHDYKVVSCRCDGPQIGTLAAQTLIRAGFRNVGILTGDLKSMVFHQMLEAFQKTLAEAGARCLPEWVVPMPGRREKFPRIAKIITSKNPPEVFFAMRDWRAEILYHEIEAAGFSIPRDFSVIGYDNISWPLAVDVGLTTIQQPAAEMGRAAVEMLRSWYLSGHRPKSRVFSGTLIERRSLNRPDLSSQRR